MKSTIIRAFVLTLAVAGFVASTQTAHARMDDSAITASGDDSTNMIPVPVCPWNDPSHCGMQ